MACELCFDVCYNLEWNSETEDDIAEDELGDAFIVDTAYRLYFCPLGEVVDCYEEVLVAS